MLFSSQKKAELFIAFNSEAIAEEGGIPPIRSYFCECCCGWHVTKNVDPPGRTFLELIQRLYQEDMRNRKRNRNREEKKRKKAEKAEKKAKEK
ncbi:MAG: hypothetical protein LBG52_04840 [Candidatus Peribacteria bacterium]|nr:hypothetical protein [Candidatus Peribacteria bacterium]